MSGSVHKDNVTIAGSLTTTGAVSVAAGSVAQAALTSTVVTTVASGAAAILNTTTEMDLTATAGAVAISTTSSFAGQQILLRATAVSGGGSYTLAVTGGTLTLDSTGEAAIIQRNAANSAWLVAALTASSSTGANIATIV